MRILHILMDGTVLDSVEGIMVPRNEETQAYYRTLKKIIAERGKTSGQHHQKESRNVL